MTSLSHKGRELISESIDTQLQHFEAAPIHNRVCEVDDGDDLVTELALAAERAYYAHAEVHGTDRGRDDPIQSATDDAFGQLRSALQARINELVARECKHVLDHAHEWTDRYSQTELEQSKMEARAWLDESGDIVDRVSELEVVQ